MQFCNAVCRWQTPSAELNDMFQKVGWRHDFRITYTFANKRSPSQIMIGFKQMLGDAAWAQETAAWPEVLLRRLNERYGV